MDAGNFTYLCDLLRSKCGISLGEDKRYLVDSRLLPLVRRMGLDDINALIEEVKRRQDRNVVQEIIEAMTTNETSFFRDNRPFDQFRDIVLPKVVEMPGSTVKVWSAASSSGQEAYSLSMLMLENSTKMKGKGFSVTGTDIDHAIIKRAEEASYTQFEVQRGLPITLLMKYFVQHKEMGEKWVLKDDVKKHVRFKYLNLLESYAAMGKFHVIFCRNVLIYFEPEIKSQILNKLAAQMEKGGFLYLGSSETITDLTDKFTIFEDTRGLYVLK